MVEANNGTVTNNNSAEKSLQNPVENLNACGRIHIITVNN